MPSRSAARRMIAVDNRSWSKAGGFSRRLQLLTPNVNSQLPTSNRLRGLEVRVRRWHRSLYQSNLLCVRFRSTVPGLVEVRHRARATAGCGAVGATGGRERVRARPDAVEHLAARRVHADADEACRSSSCSASTRGSGCRQGYVSDTGSNGAGEPRDLRRAPASAIPAGPAAGSRTGSAPRGRPARAARSLQQLEVALDRRPRRERDEGRRQRQPGVAAQRDRALEVGARVPLLEPREHRVVQRLRRRW